MATSHTLANLDAVEDSAPAYGFGHIGEARFAMGALEAEATGLAFHRLRPGMRQGIGHRHDAAEEVYVVISGSGRARVDDEILELTRLDALRVAPSATRAFEAGPAGLELLAFGPHREGDGSIVADWWQD